MSKILAIIEKREIQTDRGTPPNEYQMHLDKLAALDALVDAIEKNTRAQKQSIFAQTIK